MKKSRKKEKSREKWKSVKVNEDTYFMLKKLSLLLNMSIWKVVLVATMLFYALLEGKNDIAKRIMQSMINKYNKRKELLEKLEKNLDELI